jgi:delta-aminolevulinic acid dehydratase/porphobilinogen synthase
MQLHLQSFGPGFGEDLRVVDGELIRQGIGIDAPEPVASMPGVFQHTQESLLKEVHALADLGVPAVILFGVPAHKDATGSSADAREIAQVVQAAGRAGVVCLAVFPILLLGTVYRS